jgi:type VI secretion system protein ImpB
MEKSEQLEIGSTHKGKRVEIFMEVDDNGAIRKESIPFVVGVLASLAGEKERQTPFKDRETKSIDRENFDSVMAEIGPELHYSVECALPPDPKEKDQRPRTKLGVNLSFSEMSDFEPEQVARQIPDVASLLNERKALYALLRRLHANGRLESQIEAALEDKEKRKELLAQLGIALES